VKASNAGFHAGEVFASGWLEKREGAWLQVSSGSPTGNSFACRKDRLSTVAAISVRPKGSLIFVNEASVDYFVVQ
jgi:hypothetical protein